MSLLNLICLITILSSATTFAESKVERRLDHQEERIENGVDSGSIDEKEAARLERGQDKVQGALEGAQEDGKISHKEKRHLNKMQKNQSRKIRKSKHD